MAAGALILGLTAGWAVRDWQCDAAYAKALEKADKQRQQMQGKVDALSRSYEEERNKADVVVAREKQTIREIYKTIPAVPVDCAPDVRVLRLLEGRVSRANADASGQSSE